MQLKSSLLFAVLIVGLFSMIDAGAQAETNCPMIRVNGPAGIVRSGELISFTAHIHGDTDSLKPTYTWSLSSGKIVSGQGTRLIVVEYEDRGITATVDVGGLPTECPKSASEVYPAGDPRPSAEKLYDVPGHQALSKLNISFLSDTLRQNPSDQLYIIIHGKNSDAHQRRQTELVRAFKSIGVERDRVTMVTVFSEPSVTQFWRIPPGAEYPEPGQLEGRTKDAKLCPTISVTGPAGVTGPGELMTFSAEMSGDVPQDLLYSWAITHAKIVDGQGTLMIRAQKNDEQYPHNPVATFVVQGLPKGCPNTISERDNTIYDPGPIKLGEINNSSYTIDRNLLATIEKEMRASPNSQLYVWIYFDENERQTERLRSKILRQLSTTKIEPARFSLNFSPEKPRRAVFWQILPGVWNPAP